MGFASFSGPVRMGTVRNTTGSTPGVVRNTGLPILTQSVSLPFTVVKTSPTATNLFVIPAGSEILRVNIGVTTSITGATAVSFTIGNLASGNAFVASTALSAVTAGTWSNSFATTVAANGARNVGTTDVQVTGTFTATAGTDATGGGLYVVIEYIQRADDGSQIPSNP